MLRPRRGLQIPFPQKIRKTLIPLDGMHSFAPNQETPFGASPDMVNLCIRENRLTKRPGFTQFSTGNAAIGTRVMGLFSADDDQGSTHLYAAHPTGLAKYNTGTKVWDACTGPALTGSNTRLFRFAVSQNSVVFSQGVDQVQRVPFNTVYAILNANCPPARYLERFADRLYLAYTVEGGQQKPFRIRRPVASDHTNWTGVGSGFNELTEHPYFIKNILKLGPELAIYTEKSIWVASRLGTPSIPAQFSLRINDIGLYSQYCIKGRNDAHFFMGSDDFYIFNGSQLQSIGASVRNLIYPFVGVNSVHMNFAEIMSDVQEFLAFLCFGGEATPSRAWVFNWGRNVWYPWSVAGPTCSTIYKLVSAGVTIDQLVGTIDEQSYEIDSLPGQTDYPAMLTGHTDGKIYQWSSLVYSDNGAPINCKWTSRDLVSEDFDPSMPGKELTIKTIHIDYQAMGMGTDLQFSYSVDGGVTWQFADTVSLEANPSGGYLTASLHRQVTGNRIRFRFDHSSASETFRITAFRLEAEIRGADVTVA